MSDVYVIGTPAPPSASTPDSGFKDLARGLRGGAGRRRPGRRRPGSSRPGSATAGMDSGARPASAARSASRRWSRGAVPRAGADGQRRGRLRDRVDRLARRLEGRAVGPGAGQPGDRRREARRARRPGAGGRRSSHRHRPARPAALARLLPRAGEAAGKPFEPGAGGGTVFMDTYAMQAAWHMKRYGTTQRQIAVGASKNHHHGSLQPAGAVPLRGDARAGARRPRWSAAADARDVLADRRRRGRGAAVLRGGAGRRCPRPCARARCACAPRSPAASTARSTSPGCRASPPTRPTPAGHRPADVDLVEVHDATSFCELYQLEMLGFCPDGEGGASSSSGATALDGRAAGEPVGRTGVQGPPGRRHRPVDDPRALRCSCAARRASGRRAARPSG
jgi:hypothetical protein